MNALLWWLGENAVVTALLAVVVAAACRPLRSRPAIQHGLWLVVLVKFILPPVVAWPWSVRDLVAGPRPAPESPALAAKLAAGTSGDLTEEATSSDAVPAAEFLPTGAWLAGPEEAATEAVRQLSSERIALAVSLAWCIGCLGALVVQSRRVWRHLSLIRRGTTPPALLTEEIVRLSSALGLRPIRTVVVNRITSPFVWCLGRLRLVWPESLSSRESLRRSRGIIAHELAHVRRGDHWVAWLEFVASLLWWWNPVYWLVRRRMREAAELACDAVALSALPNERPVYAEMFLELSSRFKSGAPAPALGVSTGTPSSFERRLSMILSERVSGKMSLGGFLPVVCLALLALPGWSMVQQSSRGDEQDSPPAESFVGEIELLLVDETQPAQAKSIEERLRKLEAAIQKLTQTLQQRQTPPRSQAQKAITATWLPAAESDPVNAYKRSVYALASKSAEQSAPAPMLFKGRGRSYFFTANPKGTFLVALTEDGKQLWRTAISDTLGKIRTEGGKWSLDEPRDVKEVILRWTRSSERIDFHLDTNSGALLRQGATPHAQSTQMLLPVRQVATPSQDARLDRLEKALDDLKKQIERSPALPKRNQSGQDPYGARDLGERYLHSLYQLQVARSRVDHLKKLDDDAAAKVELEEARAALELASGNEQLLATQVQDELKLAALTRSAAQAELDYAKAMAKKGFLSQSQLERVQASAQAAEARLKQLESVLPKKSLTSPATGPQKAAPASTGAGPAAGGGTRSP